MRKPNSEYVFRVKEGDAVYLYHESSKCNHQFIGEVFSLDQALEISGIHEKAWHQAKVIQFNASREVH